MQAPIVSDLPDDFVHGVCVASCHLSVRLGFIRKVYSIVSIQLLATVLMGALFKSVESVNVFVKSSPWMMNVCVFGSVFALLMLIPLRQRHPINLYLLGVFTLLEGYLVGATVCFYETATVLQALLLCTVVTGGLTLYTFQSKYDWTVHHGMLMSMLWLLIGVGLVQVLVPFGSQMELAVSLLGAFVFSAFIVVDTQMIMRTLSTDEYVLGAINLYLDILNLFLYILRILNSRE